MSSSHRSGNLLASGDDYASLDQLRPSPSPNKSAEFLQTTRSDLTRIAMAPYPISYSFPTSMFFLILSSIFLILSTSSSSDPSPTVYEILSKFGLPSGLFPSSVQSYALADDGTFSVDLDKPCYIQFDYLVYYDKSITGKLRYGSITDLKWIRVQKLWLWFGVGEIKVDLPPSDSIYFQVGVINKKLDIDQFKTVRGFRNSNGLSCSSSLRSVFEAQLDLEMKEDSLSLFVRFAYFFCLRDR